MTFISALMENGPCSARTDRKTTEKNRRNHMRSLYSKLSSLLPHQSSRESITLPDQLGEAANYIKRLQENLERMKEKKDNLLMGTKRPNTCSSPDCGAAVGLKPPQINIRKKGSALEIVLVTGLNFQFMFNESIRVLHEEGVEIFNAGFSVVDDTVFHTIHAQAEEPALDHGAARIFERLNKLLF